MEDLLDRSAGSSSGTSVMSSALAARCARSASAQSCDDGERGEPKEIHLEQAQLLDSLHVIGGDDFVVLCAAERHQLGERTGAR